MTRNFVICFILILTASVLTATFSIAQDKDFCYECHSDPDLVMETQTGEEISIYVADSTYSKTSHGEFECIDCHTDLDGLDDMHETPLEKVDCAACHDDTQEIFATSIHGQLLEMGDKAVPTCSSCHGKHDIFPASDSKSRVNKFNLMYTCAECHQNEDLQASRMFAKPDAIPQFYESVHAKGLLKDGLIVSPSCSDCHGSHDIQNSANPTSPVNPRNVYKTCGTCHTKLEETYTKSVHGRLVSSGDQRGPVCTDCHESHKIIPPGVNFKQHSDEKCGQCHEDMLKNYHETFHGKAMALGSTEVAACYDCHGYHDIVETEDPRSHIHEDNKVATCAKCHPGANANFANYITHGDHMDRENYPQLFYVFIFMTGLLISVFILFGLHTILWIIRSLALYTRDSKTFREAKVKAREGDLAYQRFSPFQRFLHLTMIISFTTLVVTGMPLKFFASGWAQLLMKLLGGVENAGYLHRFAALILVVIFVLHVLNMSRKFFLNLKNIKNAKGRFSIGALIAYFLRPDSLIPHKRDFVDFINHNKWFFGKGEKPKFDRWTYWEKFDYFAVFWGVAIIGLSGLVMWFPVFFTKFMPGWMINVALIIHSDEALLAAGFIFTFHFFNVHFRIEKYPMDTVIFSGRISHAEMEEERAGWLERLVKNNELKSIHVKDEWAGWQPIVKTFGFMAFGTGVFLAIAIFTAMFVRLLAH